MKEQPSTGAQILGFFVLITIFIAGMLIGSAIFTSALSVWLCGFVPFIVIGIYKYINANDDQRQATRKDASHVATGCLLIFAFVGVMMGGLLIAAWGSKIDDFWLSLLVMCIGLMIFSGWSYFFKTRK